MRFVVVSHGYPQFLHWLYAQAQPTLADKSFADQRRAYYATLFATSDFYVHALQQLGHEAEEFIYNCDPMQLAWRRENLGEPPPPMPPSASATPCQPYLAGAPGASTVEGELELVQRIKRLTTGTLLRPLLARLARPYITRLHRRSMFGFPLLLEQVRRCKPDVLFVQSMYAFDNDELVGLKRHVGMLVGEQAVMTPPPPDHIDFRLYDLVVSSFPPLIDWMRGRGVRAELNRLAFDPRVDALVPACKQDLPATFAGSIFPMHRSRVALLEAVSRAVPAFEAHANVTIRVPKGSALAQRVRPPLWGRDMYGLLRRSQITLNHHGDVLPFANNLRLYEATGMGCLLVTDYKDNLADIFEPEKELITYRDAEECVDKVKFYLAAGNSPAREAISAAGRRRTLAEHSYTTRMRRLVGLIGRV